MTSILEKVNLKNDIRTKIILRLLTEKRTAVTGFTTVLRIKQNCETLGIFSKIQFSVILN